MYKIENIDIVDVTKYRIKRSSYIEYISRQITIPGKQKDVRTKVNITWKH